MGTLYVSQCKQCRYRARVAEEDPVTTTCFKVVCCFVPGSPTYRVCLKDHTLLIFFIHSNS